MVMYEYVYFSKTNIKTDSVVRIWGMEVIFVSVVFGGIS